MVCPPPRKRRKRSVSSIQSQGEGSVQRGSGLNGSGSSSSGNVSSSHTSSSSYPTSSSSSKDEPGGGGGGGRGGGGNTGGVSGSFDNQTPSQKQEREGGGHRRADGGNKEPQESQDSNTQESQNSEEKNSLNESLSFSKLYPVDPSPGCEADRSTSVTSSFPVSSGEGCVTTSTPKEGREIPGIVNSTASPSVGYGGGCEEREGEKREEGNKEGEAIELAQELEDTDATLGESELNVEEEEEEQENGKGTESPPSSSSTTWQLVCSSNSNTCSTAKSSTATSQLSVHHALLSGSQFHDSLPDSELPPLVIDIQESQNSQISTTTGVGLTTVAQQSAKTWDKIEKVEGIEQGLEEKQEHNSAEEGGEETDEMGDDVQEEGRGGLIKEAWKRLYQDDSVRSKVPSSPMKSQLTASQVESDSESLGQGEEVDGDLEPSSAFSLHLTQSQTTPIEGKTTPTTQQNEKTIQQKELTTPTIQQNGETTPTIQQNEKTTPITQQIEKTTPTIQQNRETTPTIQQNEETTPTIRQDMPEPTRHSVQEGQRVEVSTRDSISTPALTPDSDQSTTVQYHQKEVAFKDASEGFSVQCDVVGTARPVPTYESVTLEESTPFQSPSLPPSHSPHQTSPQPQQPSGPPSTCSQAQSMEVSQTSTSSAGETFHTTARIILEPIVSKKVS